MNVWEKITNCGVDIDFFVVVNVFFYVVNFFFKFSGMYNVVNQKIKGLGFYGLFRSHV